MFKHLGDILKSVSCVMLYLTNLSFLNFELVQTIEHYFCTTVFLCSDFVWCGMEWQVIWVKKIDPVFEHKYLMNFS